jgi:serine/threonine protein kinase
MRKISTIKMVFLFMFLHEPITSATQQAKTSENKKEDLREKKKKIKDRASRNGFYEERDMDFLLQHPNPLDFCHDLTEKIKISDEIHTFDDRQLNTCKIKSAENSDDECWAEILTYTGKNYKRILKEINFLKINKNKPLVTKLEACYVNRGQNNESDPTKIFLVYRAFEFTAEQFLLRIINEEETLDEKEMSKMLRGFALSLQLLHSSEIAHCKVSLRSFWLRKHNEISIGCLHYARKVYEQQEISKRKSGVKYYRSPQINDSRCELPDDVYALGVVFRALLTKTKPEDFSDAPDANKKDVYAFPDSFKKYEKLISEMCDRDAKERPDINKVVKKLEKIDRELHPQKPEKPSSLPHKKNGKKGSKPTGRNKGII